MDQSCGPALNTARLTVLNSCLVATLFAVLIASCSRDEAAVPLPVEASWVSPQADLATSLTLLPPSCEAKITTPAEALLRMQGKALFESPALLGGKAAQSGLSCGSCHLNGRGNPDFVFQGVSAAPGTADVTSGFFSKTHADETFNPVPIPDLAAKALKFPDRRTAEFQAFLTELIEGEFSGQRTPPQALNALSAYLQSISPAECQTQSETRSWRTDLALARTAYESGMAPKAAENGKAARLYLRVARSHLERLHARYALAETKKVQQSLVALSTDMGRLIGGHDREDVADRAKLTSNINVQFSQVEKLLAQYEDASLYNRAALASAIRHNAQN